MRASITANEVAEIADKMEKLDQLMTNKHKRIMSPIVNSRGQARQFNHGRANSKVSSSGGEKR